MTSVNLKLPSAVPNLKLQLATSAQVNNSDLSSLIKQVIKGSKSSDTLSQVHRSFAATESNIENSFGNFKKLYSLVKRLDYQHLSIDENIKNCTSVVEQLNAIEQQTSELLQSSRIAI